MMEIWLSPTSSCVGSWASISGLGQEDHRAAVGCGEAGPGLMLLFRGRCLPVLHWVLGVPS